MPAVWIRMSGLTCSTAPLTSSGDVMSTRMKATPSGKAWSPGGFRSMMVIVQPGCFSAMARTVAEPTKPVPPETRTLFSAGGSAAIGVVVVEVK